MIGPIHIKAKKGEVAERVIVAGDPARVKQLADMINGKLVNENRGLLVYTGEYKGVPITVAMHGIGGPSSAIVFEELIMLGAKVMIRLGSCGAMVKGLKIGDVVIPTAAAYYPGGIFYQYTRDNVCLGLAPHYEVLNALIDEAKRQGLKFVVGPIISSDAFYAEDPEFVKKWTSRGVIAVEMECATLFMLGAFKNIKTGALLVVSDSLVEELGFADAEQLRPYIEKASKVVLEALTRIPIG